MRLVDLLLSPRQPSYGVVTKESPNRQSFGAVYHKPRHSDGPKSAHRNLRYCGAQDAALNQPKVERSSRSSGALSDLLLSKTSHASFGYWSQSPAAPASASSVAREIPRLIQPPDSEPTMHGYVKRESDDTMGFTARGFDICSDNNRQPYITMDKTLNGNIWKREEYALKSSSSSSTPSSPSQSSIGLEDQVFSRRRFSLLSSDGSELEPEQMLPFMADSDSYQSLSSPLEAMGAVRWMEQTSSSSAAGCLDWQNGDDGDRNGYDIDACPLFNFNFFDNTLDDSPFELLQDKERDVMSKYDESGLCHNPVVTMAPDAMATDAVKKSGSMSEIYTSLNSYGDHLFRQDERGADRRNPFIHNSNDGPARRMNRSVDSLTTNSEGGIVFPPASLYAAAVTAPGPRTTTTVSTETVHQSEVVKLLLQNRHQWALPPLGKTPPSPVGCRGSRKRAPATAASVAGRDSGRTKMSRPSKPGLVVPMTAAAAAAEPPRSMSSASSSSSSSASSSCGQVRHASASEGRIQEYYDDDNAMSLEKLIMELMLLESAKEDLLNVDLSRADDRVNASRATTTPPTVDLEISPISSSITDLFEGLATCRTSDAELFSSLELDSIYLSDCEPLFTPQEVLCAENARNFEVYVKTEPNQNMSPFSSPFQSQLESFSRQVDLLSGQDATKSPNKSLSNNESRSTNERRGSVLESALQTKYLLHSVNCDSNLENREVVSDHDYCQSLGLLSFNGLRDLSYDQTHLEKRRKYAESCFSRNRECSALKSLLLDSNLTEEVRKEAELVRAKSRKKMSEKLRLTSVNDPLRMQRLGKVCEEKILMQQLKDGDDAASSPIELSCLKEANDESDPVTYSDNVSRETEDFEMETKPEESCPVRYKLITDGSKDETLQCHDSVIGVASPETEWSNSDSGVDTLVTSDLELSSGDDAVFFNSFEDFYNNNQDPDLDISNDSENADSEQHADPVTSLERTPARADGRRRVLKRPRYQSSTGKNGRHFRLLANRFPPRTNSSRWIGRMIGVQKDRSAKRLRVCSSKISTVGSL